MFLSTCRHCPSSCVRRAKEVHRALADQDPEFATYRAPRESSSTTTQNQTTHTQTQTQAQQHVPSCRQRVKLNYLTFLVDRSLREAEESGLSIPWENSRQYMLGQSSVFDDYSFRRCVPRSVWRVDISGGMGMNVCSGIMNNKSNSNICREIFSVTLTLPPVAVCLEVQCLHGGLEALRDAAKGPDTSATDITVIEECLKQVMGDGGGGRDCGYGYGYGFKIDQVKILRHYCERLGLDFVSKYPSLLNKPSKQEGMVNGGGAPSSGTETTSDTPVNVAQQKKIKQKPTCQKIQNGCILSGCNSSRHMRVPNHIVDPSTMDETFNIINSNFEQLQKEEVAEDGYESAAEETERDEKTTKWTASGVASRVKAAFASLRT